MAHVLLADDDAVMRELVNRALVSDGHKVEMALDGQDALDQAANANQPFDVLVSDVQMPSVDGISLATQLLAAQPKLRVVLMSGLQTEMVRAASLKAQGVQFILKPFTLEQIRSIVRKALA
jgi:two-component system, cell cycle response regulator CpdR